MLRVRRGHAIIVVHEAPYRFDDDDNDDEDDNKCIHIKFLDRV